MVKPLEKSIKLWDGHGLLRLVELHVGEGQETKIEQAHRFRAFPPKTRHLGAHGDAGAPIDSPAAPVRVAVMG